MAVEVTHLRRLRSNNWILAEAANELLPGEGRWELELIGGNHLIFSGRALLELAEVIDAWRASTSGK